jgi:hypothetical protein
MLPLREMSFDQISPLSGKRERAEVRQLFGQAGLGLIGFS